MKALQEAKGLEAVLFINENCVRLSQLIPSQIVTLFMLFVF